jgi:hypothetical protein
VEVTAGIHAATGQVFATFLSIDPTTGLPPDVLVGFLPPEDGTGRGKGYISYSVQPDAGLPTGTQITNVADISFDGQQVITTDQVNDEDPTKGTDPSKEALVTIDSAPPTSSVEPLPSSESSPSFTVTWSGQDDSGGSGVATYSIYVSDDGGAYTPFVVNSANTSALFTGQGGHTYRFYSVATDNVGNVQLTPAAAQASTYVLIQTTTSLSSLSADPSNATQSLSFTATVTGGVPDGQTVMLEDASNGNKVIATGTLSNGSATLTVPAGTLLAGSHNLIAVYGGDANFAASQSATYVQTVRVVVTSVVVNGNLRALAGAQRSMVDSIVYSFSEAVNLGANAFSIAIHTGQSGVVPTLIWTALNPNADGSSTQWVVTFSGAGVVGGSIANGIYDITMNATAVTSDANPAVTSQARATDTFWRLYGDLQGNGFVSNADYNAFLSTYGLKSTQTGYLAAFDATGTNAKISNADYLDFLSDYGLRYKNVLNIATI